MAILSIAGKLNKSYSLSDYYITVNDNSIMLVYDYKWILLERE